MRGRRGRYSTVGCRASTLKRAHPVALAGEPQAAQVLRGDEARDVVVGALVDEDLTRAGRRLQSRRDVHRVADDGVVHAPLGADVAGDDLAGRDADAEVQPHPRQRRDLEAHHLVLHGERRPDGPLGIVGVDHRRTEAGDHAVAEEVGDGAPVELDRVAHDRQVAVEQVQRRLGWVLGGERGVAAHVGEQRRDLPPIAAQRDRGRITEHLGGDVLADVAAEQVGQPVLERLRPEQGAQRGRPARSRRTAWTGSRSPPPPGRGPCPPGRSSAVSSRMGRPACSG